MHTVLYTYFSVKPSIKVVRSALKEIVPTTNGNLTFSLMKLLDCFFKPFIPKEVCLLHLCTPDVSIFSFTCTEKKHMSCIG